MATGMNAKPKEFCGEDVLKILSGSKTMFREPIGNNVLQYMKDDVLYVQEMFKIIVPPVCDHNPTSEVIYKIDKSRKPIYFYEIPGSLFNDDDWNFADKMHYDASRILIKITDVKQQRIQEISADDCIREGIAIPGPADPGDYVPDPWEVFEEYWNHITNSGKGSRTRFSNNPLVNAFSFNLIWKA